jgi:hypothetical protein
MSIDVNYYSFSPSRADSGWKNFKKDFLAIRQKNVMCDKDIELTFRQKSLFDDSYAGDFFYLKKLDDNDICYGLKSVDLYYGARRNDYFESPKVEAIFMECIIEHFKLEIKNEIPKKEEWIRAFESLKADDVQAISEMLAVSIGWEIDEAQYGLIDYLKSVRPVIVDLKETKDAVFARWYGGYLEVGPQSSESILSERVKKHADKYKEILEN